MVPPERHFKKVHTRNYSIMEKSFFLHNSASYMVNWIIVDIIKYLMLSLANS